jgi:hypothetical protein
VLLALACYAGVFIARTAFLVDGTWHFTLFDDAMISMRYARNLAAGHGLVWNPGEAPVEGYSNPLWVLYMALLHLLPVSESKASLLVQATGTVLLLANLALVAQVAAAAPGACLRGIRAALLLTALYFPLVNWTLQGTEVGLLACLTTGAVWLAAAGRGRGRSATSVYVLLGVGTLVRLDMVVPLLAAAGFFWFEEPGRRRFHVTAAAAILLASLSLQTGLRVWYYGDWLPNTYYLKLAGYPVLLRWARGLIVLVAVVVQAGVFPFVLPFVSLAYRRSPTARLIAWLVSAQALYSVYVGGDAWEDWGGSNRFLSVVMPVLFVLLGQVLADLSGLAARLRPEPAEAGGRPGAGQGAYAVLVGGCLLSLNATYGAPALAQWLLLASPPQVLRRQAEVEVAYVVRAVTRPEASVAVIWAGTLPYFAHRRAIDLLGKSDRRIARLPMRQASGAESLVFFWPGHLKHDYGYSIGSLAPDVVVSLRWPLGEARALLEADYERVEFAGKPFYVRRSSPNVRREGLALLRSR